MVDRDSAEWWARVGRREFVVQECNRCGTRRFPARGFCAECRREGWRWVAVEPVGRVESWIVNHRPFAEGVTVVMVRLDAVPDALVHGNWAGEREPVGGEPVEGVFTTIDREAAGGAPAPPRGETTGSIPTTRDGETTGSAPAPPCGETTGSVPAPSGGETTGSVPTTPGKEGGSSSVGEEVVLVDWRPVTP